MPPTPEPPPPSVSQTPLHPSLGPSLALSAPSPSRSQGYPLKLRRVYVTTGFEEVRQARSHTPPRGRATRKLFLSSRSDPSRALHLTLPWPWTTNITENHQSGHTSAVRRHDTSPPHQKRRTSERGDFFWYVLPEHNGGTPPENLGSQDLAEELVIAPLDKRDPKLCQCVVQGPRRDNLHVPLPNARCRKSITGSRAPDTFAPNNLRVIRPRAIDPEGQKKSKTPPYRLKP